MTSRNLAPGLTYLACLLAAIALLAWGIATNDPAPVQRGQKAHDA